jgi:hypothetical protein
MRQNHKIDSDQARMQKCATRPSGLYMIELIDIVPQKTVSMAIKIQQKKELKTFPMNAMMPPVSKKCPASAGDGILTCPDCRGKGRYAPHRVSVNDNLLTAGCTFRSNTADRHGDRTVRDE